MFPALDVRPRRIGKRIHHVRDKPDLRWRKLIELRLEFLKVHLASILRSIKSTNEGLSSMPTHRRPKLLPASKVVPDPA